MYQNQHYRQNTKKDTWISKLLIKMRGQGREGRGLCLGSLWKKCVCGGGIPILFALASK